MNLNLPSWGRLAYALLLLLLMMILSLIMKLLQEKHQAQTAPRLQDWLIHAVATQQS